MFSTWWYHNAASPVSFSYTVEPWYAWGNPGLESHSSHIQSHSEAHGESAWPLQASEWCPEVLEEHFLFLTENQKCLSRNSEDVSEVCKGCWQLPAPVAFRHFRLDQIWLNVGPRHPHLVRSVDKVDSKLYNYIRSQFKVRQSSLPSFWMGSSQLLSETTGCFSWKADTYTFTTFAQHQQNSQLPSKFAQYLTLLFSSD